MRRDRGRRYVGKKGPMQCIDVVHVVMMIMGRA